MAATHLMGLSAGVLASLLVTACTSGTDGAPGAPGGRSSDSASAAAATSSRDGGASLRDATAWSSPDAAAVADAAVAPDAATAVEGGATARDVRYWPFSVTSPWNTPIGSDAKYVSVAGLGSLPGDVNFDGAWTTSVAIAQASDPPSTLYINATGSSWSFLANGGKVCGNSATDEQSLLAVSSTTLTFHSNPYSTKPTGTFHDAEADYSSQLRLPAGVCASPDSDGHLAIFQPGGWVVEIYDAIRLSNGDVVGGMASYVDPTGDGTGYWNGRKASLFPDFAGLIRTGEIARGLIPHALVATAPPTILTKPEVWPASAYDTNDGYSGTLPMGSLLAIPASVVLEDLTPKLSPQGLVLAHALQDFGVYVGDRGGAGLSLQAELGDPDLGWSAQSSDLTTLVHALQRVANNTQATPGGGGVPRAPAAPP